MYVTRKNIIEVYFFFSIKVIFLKFWGKNGIFSEILLSISKFKAGGVLSKVLKISQI